jgi:SAM-dependent methyltransferase
MSGEILMTDTGNQKRHSMKKSSLTIEYSDKPLTDFPEKLINHLAERFQLKGRMIDIMCGRGEHAQAFYKLGLDAWGSDIDPAAAQVLEKRDERLVLCNVNNEALPFKDNSFDVVFCKSAIEHTHPDHLIPEIYRILKPGGKVVILTLDWYYTYRMYYIDHTHAYGCPWMKHSLMLILKTYEFRDVIVENFYYLPFTWESWWGKILCTLIRMFPYPYNDNFTNPIWKIIRFSNEVQILGVGTK